MPKRSDAEWQALDTRIAQEVVGLEQKESLYGNGRLWNSQAGHQYQVASSQRYETIYKDWQPHKDVAQAMLALRTLLAKVHRATASLFMGPSSNRYYVTIQNWVASSEAPAMWIKGPYTDNERHAICLAIEQFLDGRESWQKEHGC